MNSTNSTTEYGTSDIPTPLVTLVAFIMSILSIVGTIGNILVITAVNLHKKLRSVHNVFIINLAVADLFVTTIVIPSAIFGALDNKDHLKSHDDLCDLIGSLVVVCCVTSIQSIANIALERYIFICLNDKYAKFYNRITIPLVVAGIWFYAFLVDCPNLTVVGWGMHGYNPQVRACSYMYSVVVESGYIWFLFVFGWGIPFVFICFCYTRLYLFVRQNSFPKRYGTTTTTDSTTMSETAPTSRSTRKGMKSADERLLHVVAIIVLFFCLMWAPLALLGILNGYVIEVPNWLHFLSGHLGIANSCINFIIYAYNKDFKEGYRLVWKKITS